MLVTFQEGDQDPVVVTGWRKWLIVTAALFFVAILVLVTAALLFGIAITLSLGLLVAIPLLCAMGLVAWLRMRTRRADSGTP